MSNHEISELRAEVEELRALVGSLADGTGELRVRRLVVVDHEGVERITAATELTVQAGGDMVSLSAGSGLMRFRAPTASRSRAT